MTNSQSTQTKVHVRASEIAATVAVVLGKVADGVAQDSATVLTHWSHDAQGFGNKVKVTEVMWSATGTPKVIFVLENGQEFEAEVRPSSRALREAALGVDLATRAAERAQDTEKGR